MTDAPACRDVLDVYRAHGDFVWLTLQRLGASPPDLEDLFQEVFVVVHRKWSEFAGDSKVTTWLFSIAARVMSRHRRRAHHKRESLPGELPELSDVGAQDEAVADQQARATLAAVLDAMDPARRAVFVMAMIEGLSQTDIAAQLGLPVGTVYSRLHAAREDFESRVAKLHRKGGV